MRVLICGATGNIGRLTVNQALSAGHEVTALARSPQKLDNQSNLNKAQGDVRDAASIEAAMVGQEAVITVFGAPLNWSTVTSVPDLCTTGTRNIISAMKQQEVKRLICMTGIGAGDSREHGRFVFDNLILPLLLGRIYADKNRQEREVMQSNLDWTIVRPAELTDESETDDYRVLTDLKGQKAKTIARTNVADFLVKQVKSDRFLHQTPLITK
ncbi:Glycerol-3-phosphate acyltransferase PlsX [Hyella patelloides LEGE 07179]|uniref:Glycerol-3-phosphate acyltransferase PlsX n=1 Tax=Hyella patelloides LEGE 07179 TaxID=945734 RepID=A0A563VP17_9CYAN|nr:SDR family oxidoreductase [Hyella patelloides]VEP13025.1 Glycerol-3-phosphate acyltransferase PlsX [Hyella patelloides LEGE 07179]